MKKTVFILGAGASKAFGDHMPIGSNLADQISEALYAEFHERVESKSPIRSALRRSPSGLSSEHERAATLILGALQAKPSIDELIDDWPAFPEVAEVGKAAIAACILKAEQECSMKLPMSQKADWGRVLRGVRDSWAGQLFRAVGSRTSMPNAFLAFRDIAFVTFNYDRCLEQYLLANFMHSSGMAPDVAAAAMAHIEIHHAYGSLGDLPLGAGSGRETEFGSDEHWAVVDAARRIKTFTEQPGDVSRIQSLVLNAQRLVFLGFGYHRRNLDLLFGVGRNAPPVECWGTDPGLSRRARAIKDECFEACQTRSSWKQVMADVFLQQHVDDIVAFEGW